MATTAEVIEFTEHDTGLLVERMGEFSLTGEGWINIGPGLTPEEFSTLPPRSAIAKFFSGRGPAVPMATWTPRSSRDRGGSAQVGIDHGTGPNALDRLAEAGIVLPAGWRKTQDHGKHGIVAEIVDDAAHDSVVEWLLRAMTVLSPRIAIGHDWIAEAYGG